VLKTGETLSEIRPHRGDFEDWIARGLGEPVERLVVASIYAGDALPDPEAIGGVVVTGSPAMVSDREDWSEAAARWLAEVVRADAMPVLGLCYGHQLLAHGLGGRVAPNPRGREMGTVEVRFSSRAGDGEVGLGPLFEPGVFPGHTSHVESVLEPPRGARVLAATDLDPHHALAFGPRQWGVQFHPEFDRDVMRRYVEVRREVLVGEGLDPDAMIESARETPALTGVLERFARFVAAALA